MHLANLPLAEAFKSLGTSELGLTPAEAARRLGEYGPNHIAEIGVEAPWRCFLREFTHFFAVILWIAAGLAFYAESRSHGEGMWQLGVAIIAEGLVLELDPEELKGLAEAERDAHGHLRIADVNIGEILKAAVQEELRKLGVKATVTEGWNAAVPCAAKCAPVAKVSA